MGYFSIRTCCLFSELLTGNFLLVIYSYVVDASDREKFETCKKELHDLLSKPPLERIPLLVLGNKNDLPEAIDADELIQELYVILPPSFHVNYFEQQTNTLFPIGI